jgi:hypothetical protein
MTRSLVYRLVLNDWYLQRHMIVAGFGAGTVCLALLSTSSRGLFYAGLLGLLTVLICVGCGLTFSTVVTERKTQVLAFVMSLPVTPRDYTVAKLLSNATIFLVFWCALVGGTIGLILLRPGVPDGLVPLALITLAEILASSTLVLTTAIMTESEAWTVASLIAGNLALNGVIFAAGQAPTIGGLAKADAISWSPAALTALGIEGAAIVLLVALTFYVQGRKTSFI